MRRAIEQLDKEIKRVRKGYELTRFGEGYIAGIEYCKEIIQKNIDNLIVPGNTYFVILYEDGNPFMPHVKEMKLISRNPVKKKIDRFQFSFDLEANNTLSGVDLEISSVKQLRARVFFTYEQAEREIKNSLKG